MPSLAPNRTLSERFILVAMLRIISARAGCAAVYSSI
jgi:hypothetical protein